jgi:hypothetical protein
MEIEIRKTRDLIPYINNARVHDVTQVLQIASSIKEFGFNNPVLIDQENGIIAGHGRVLAAEKLNLYEVPCIVLKDLTEAQKKAYIIADNKLAENSEWNDELLKLEIERLQDFDIDINLLGFTYEHLDKLLFLNTEGDYPSLNSEDRSQFTDITFYLHYDQAETVKKALSMTRKIDFQREENENINGNGINYICSEWISTND